MQFSCGLTTPKDGRQDAQQDCGKGEAEPPDIHAMVIRFVKRFGACPVTRLELAPGEGVFVPASLVAHDLDARGASDLVVTVVALPGA